MIGDPEDEEYAEMKEWLIEGFDPELFNVNKIYERLATANV